MDEKRIRAARPPALVAQGSATGRDRLIIFVICFEMLSQGWGIIIV